MKNYIIIPGEALGKTIAEEKAYPQTHPKFMEFATELRKGMRRNKKTLPDEVIYIAYHAAFVNFSQHAPTTNYKFLRLLKSFVSPGDYTLNPKRIRVADLQSVMFFLLSIDEYICRYR